jgi:hypothetical protein
MCYVISKTSCVVILWIKWKKQKYNIVEKSFKIQSKYHRKREERLPLANIWMTGNFSGLVQAFS